MDPIIIKLSAEEAEDLRHALSVAKDALVHSDRHAAVCALVGPEECDAFDKKVAEAQGE